MDQFETFSLGELYFFSSGLSKGRQFFGKGYEFVSFKDVFYNYFLPEKLTELVESTEKEQYACSVKRGDVFLTRTSETMEELGQSSVALKDYSKATFNGFTKRLRPKDPERIVPEYVGYYLRSPKFRAQVTSFAIMTTRASLNNEILNRLTIDLPPIKIQTGIGEILKSLDDKIELNNKINQNLETLAQTLFKQWFVDFEFPIENGECYKTSGGELVESELGEIPIDWSLGILEELTKNLGSGGTPKTSINEYYEGDVEWYSTKELQDGFLIGSERKISEVGLKNSSAKLFPKNTVVMAIYAAPTVGRLGILNDQASFNQAAVGLVADEEKTSFEYLFLLLKTERKKLNSLSNGAAQQNLNVSIVKNYPIIIPNPVLSMKFKETIRPIFENIRTNTIENLNLTMLRNTLLPKLISGELEVNESLLEQTF